jgi:hypothetical protein
MRLTVAGPCRTLTCFPDVQPIELSRDKLSMLGGAVNRRVAGQRTRNAVQQPQAARPAGTERPVVLTTRR